MSQAISRWSDDQSVFHATWMPITISIPRWLDGTVSLIGMTTWIGIVAAYDVYLTILYAFTLEDFEVNPAARAIMKLNAPPDEFLTSLALFIGLKCAGIVVVISAVYMISIWRKHMALMVASGVSAFQFWLLLFLCFGGA